MAGAPPGSRSGKFNSPQGGAKYPSGEPTRHSGDGAGDWGRCLRGEEAAGLNFGEAFFQ